MVRLKFSIELNYQVADAGCDFIFNIHAAHTRNQVVSDERLELSQRVDPVVSTDPATGPFTGTTIDGLAEYVPSAQGGYLPGGEHEVESTTEAKARPARSFISVVIATRQPSPTPPSRCWSTTRSVRRCCW